MTFIVLIVLLFGPLLLDMYHRHDKHVSLREAALWSGAYVGSALLFALFLYAWNGPNASALFLSGYLVEKSLSVDNLLVFGSIFAYFGVADRLQYRVLHWGIVGSVILRLLFVACGLFVFVLFGRLLDVVFGAFVIWTAVQLLRKGDSADSPIDHNARWYIKWTKKLLPVSGIASDQFFVRGKYGWLDSMPTATPLFLCLLAIEFTDIAFAFDSVPVVIGITKNMTLAFSSIMFAVVGLRSLYFVLNALMKYTANLQTCIVVVLCFIGVKLVVHGIFGAEISASVTLFVILAALFYAVGVPLLKPKIEPIEPVKQEGS